MRPHTSCCTSALVLSIVAILPGASRAAQVVFDTNSGIMTVDGIPRTDFFGVTVQQQVVSRPEGIVQEFRFLGNMEFIFGDTVSAFGSRPLVLVAANDAIIQPGATLNFSTTGRFGILGGGDGGGNVAGGSGGLGGSGAGGNFFIGVGGDGGTTGAGGVDGHQGGLGSNGTQGSIGGLASSGFSGVAGTAGFNNPASGGTGGSAGSVNSVGGSGAVGAGGTRGAGGATSTGFEEGHDGGNGGAGGTGGSGGNASAGIAGGSGFGGRNLTTGLALSAGGGGGSGGSGAGGGGGGGGSSGGTGGGGGGGGLGIFGVLLEHGAAGGGGGFGGAGGNGGNGASGAASAAGGGGGGAVEIAALGRVSMQGSLLVQGGASGTRSFPLAPQFGSAGSAGLNGFPGATSPTGLGGDGGRGGNGGAGGAGGNGGAGGEAGQGGGGAGGTLILRGTIASAAGGTVNAAGGTSPVRPGDAGRFLIADNGNLVPSFGTTIGATTADFAGMGGGGVNPFIQGGATSTFNVVDLTGGADVYGLKSGVTIDSSYFDSVRTGAPVGAVAAVVRRAAGPGAGEGYFAHDLLMLVNLTPSPLANPQLGVGASGSGFSAPLKQQGFARNPLFGGAGPVTLSSLPAGGVYATLVPNGSTMEVNARAGDATLNGLSFATLGTLGVAYLTASTAADFNFDGRVTGADFLLWQRGGSPNPRSATDLAQWKSNYGAGAATPTAIAVPEPQAWLLCGLALFGLRHARRR